MTTFAVVTPTIGSDHLAQCIESLKNQDCIHYIFCDGIEHYHDVQNILATHGHRNIRLTVLEENVGRNGGNWYGHRVYAAASFLVNQDVICYLDEDNWVNSYFIRAYENTLSHYQWAFTLRNIYSKDGKEICPDNCESLGKWPVYGTGDNYHIDTSCFAVPRSVALQIGHAWYGQYAADRQFFTNLRHNFPNFGCTKKHTVNYRLEGNEKSVSKEFFEEGNKRVQELYGDKEFPWHETTKTLTINTAEREFLIR